MYAFKRAFKTLLFISKIPMFIPGAGVIAKLSELGKIKPNASLLSLFNEVSKEACKEKIFFLI